jgi:hypothetical protein
MSVSDVVCHRNLDINRRQELFQDYIGSCLSGIKMNPRMGQECKYLKKSAKLVNWNAPTQCLTILGTL